ncbi:MAG TPA: aminopeptidase N [Propionibacteriaceae bacterium]|nr:aminopeptidase N [Propionibacteriaceae bacterium]
MHVDLSANSLQRGEAESRAAQLTISHTVVEIDLTNPSANTYASRTTITFESRGSESFLDFKGHVLTSASLNGVELSPSAWRAGRIPLRDLRPNNTVVVEGQMSFSTVGEGLHRHVDPQDGEIYLYAMSFLDAAPRWFACFDQPDLKSSYEMHVRTPEGWTVLGNGPSQQVAPGRWRIVQSTPLSTYFVTLVAGPYASVLAEHDGIRLGLHARKSLEKQLGEQAEDMLTVTKQCLDYYHRTFARRYPFGEYHQAFVPDFNAGAMENPGCVTFRDTYVYRGHATRAELASRAGVIAHEMAHMWFGDLVTMRWWDDLWLNESFAEYMTHRCCTDATDYPLWIEFGIVRKDRGSVDDQSPSSHPVAGSTAADAASALQYVDGITYAKGAAVIKQLVAYLGDSVFLGGLHAYFDRYRFGNATLGELIKCWSEAGAVDLPSWAESWLRTTGMDTLEVVGEPPEVAIVKASASQASLSRSHSLSVGSIDARGAVSTAAEVIVADTPVPITVPADASLVIPDLHDDTWAKIRFGPDGWSRVAAVLPGIADEQVAVVMYNAVRDAVRDAALAPARALDLICEGLRSCHSDVILASVAGFAQDQLAGAYCPVAERTERLERVHLLAWQVLGPSQPGSDHQLTAFRQVVRSASDVGQLRQWYRGDHLPEGVVLDPELAWNIVQRVAELTDDRRLIAHALDRDPSAAAHVHAARARASLPDAHAKEAAWTLLMRPSAVPGLELYAAAEGFFAPNQSDLLEPFVARYFSEIGNTAQFRTGWPLGEVAARAYPWSAVTPATVELAEQTMAGELAVPLRRALIDGTDRIRRAVRSLATFG